MSSFENFSCHCFSDIKGPPASRRVFLIAEFPEMLRFLTRFSPQVMQCITAGTDTRMDIIADIHTESNTGRVLEEAVGSPANIYVLIRDDRGARLCRDGVFTYYEFKQPMQHRLTDEQWEQMAQAMGNQAVAVRIWPEKP